MKQTHGVTAVVVDLSELSGIGREMVRLEGNGKVGAQKVLPFG